MAWIAPVVSGAMSLISSMSAGNDEGEAMDEQANTAQQNENFQETRYNNVNSMLSPMEQSENSMATSSGPTAYFGQEKGAFESGIGQARTQIMGQTGIGTGAQAEEMGALGLNEAKGLGSLQQQDDQRKQQILQSQESLMANQANGAANNVNSAAGMASNAFGNQAGYYSQMATAGMNSFSNSMNGLGKALNQ